MNESNRIYFSKLVNSDNNTTAKGRRIFDTSSQLTELSQYPPQDTLYSMENSLTKIYLWNSTIQHIQTFCYSILVFTLSCTSLIHSEFWICTSTEAQNQLHFLEDDVLQSSCSCCSFEPSFISFESIFFFFFFILVRSIVYFSLVAYKNSLDVITVIFIHTQRTLYIVNKQTQRYYYYLLQYTTCTCVLVLVE